MDSLHGCIRFGWNSPWRVYYLSSFPPDKRLHHQRCYSIYVCFISSLHDNWKCNNYLLWIEYQWFGLKLYSGVNFFCASLLSLLIRVVNLSPSLTGIIILIIVCTLISTVIIITIIQNPQCIAMSIVCLYAYRKELHYFAVQEKIFTTCSCSH